MPNSSSLLLFSFGSVWFGFLKPLPIDLRDGELVFPLSSHGKLGGDSQDADHSHQKELSYQLLQYLSDVHIISSSLLQSKGRALWNNAPWTTFFAYLTEVLGHSQPLGPL